MADAPFDLLYSKTPWCTQIAWLCFTGLELWMSEVGGYRDFRPFLLLWSWPWVLDPMTFIYELDPHSLEIYRSAWTVYIKAFKSYHLTNRQTDRQTRQKLYTMLLCEWSIMHLHAIRHY